MAFKSNEFTESAGFTSKTLEPGTHYARIVDLKLEEPKYKPGSAFVFLVLEGIDQGDEFQGFVVDQTNPAMGNYRGQIATVQNGKFAFSDYNYNGKDITKDEQIFRWVNTLAKQMGVLDKMNAANVEAETIEEYIALVKKYVVNPELWGTFVIAGQKYIKEGSDFPGFRLFFPKAESKCYPFSAILDEEGEPLNLLTFDKSKHVEEPYVKPEQKIESFEGQKPKSSEPSL